MPKLDGTEKHADLNTPFDAHDKRVRGTHVPTTADTPSLPHGDEYPKHLGFHKKTGAQIVAKNADHEAQLQEAAEYQDEAPSGEEVSE